MGRAHPPELVEKIRCLAARGSKAHEIAEMVGLETRTVRLACETHKIALPTRFNKPHTIEAVRTLAGRGHNARDIAQRLALSRNAVIGICSRNQITLPITSSTDPRVNRVGYRRNKPLKVAKAGHFELAPLNRLGPSPAGKFPPPPKNEPEPLRDANGDLYTLETAHFTSCRWIAGDPTAEATICGIITKPGEPYCAFHKARARQKSYLKPEHINHVAAWGQS